jgi:hypothetical protein
VAEQQPSRVGWHAVDRWGQELASDRRPGEVPGLGSPSPAVALAAAPVATWPPMALASDGRRVGLAAALGSGGDEVEALLSRLLASPGEGDEIDVPCCAATTPVGPVELPVAVVSLAEGVEVSASVDPAWMAAVEARRRAPRRMLVDAGRGDHLEAALHVGMLLTTEWLEPAEDAGPDARVASGAQLWVLSGAIAWALTARGVNPFGSWAHLVTSGLWPVGPTGGRLVVARTDAADGRGR